LELPLALPEKRWKKDGKIDSLPESNSKSVHAF